MEFYRRGFIDLYVLEGGENLFSGIDWYFGVDFCVFWGCGVVVFFCWRGFGDGGVCSSVCCEGICCWGVRLEDWECCKVELGWEGFGSSGVVGERRGNWEDEVGVNCCEVFRG